MSEATKTICKMRSDLVEEFPDGFISDDAQIYPEIEYEYRWLNEDEDNEQFQIFTLNFSTNNYEWYNAMSIDFDFID